MFRCWAPGDYPSRINLVQSEASRFADTTALYQALGGGWWQRADLAQHAQ
jgi:outer membrane protein TolC